jgi:hypothetical protein
MQILALFIEHRDEGKGGGKRVAGDFTHGEQLRRTFDLHLSPQKIELLR